MTRIMPPFVMPDPVADDGKFFRLVDGQIVFDVPPLPPHGHPAADITVVPVGGLGANNLQLALQELDAEKSNVGHTHAALPASDLPFAPAGNLQATTVQGALVELDTEKAAAGHAHNAAATAFTPTGGVAATTVQAAIAELDSEKAASGHTHTAANTGFTPAGSLAATTVQAALVELDNEKSASGHNHGAAGVTFSATGSLSSSTVQAALAELDADVTTFESLNSAHRAAGPTGVHGITADAAAGSPSLRTLGSGALQAAAGNHVHAVALGDIDQAVWTGVHGSGTLAARPAAAAGNAGYFYTATDQLGGTTYRSTGSAWVQIAGSVSSGSPDPNMGGDLSGTVSNAQINAGAVGLPELASAAKTIVAVIGGRRGNLAAETAGSSTLRWHNDTGQTVTFTQIRYQLGTAPTGSGVTVVVRRDGNATAVDTGSIAASALNDVNTGLSITVANGQYLEVWPTAVGSTVPGADLVVTARGTLS